MQRTVAPLTVEALAVLDNERLAHESRLGRISLEDVRRAVAYGIHPLVDTMSLDGDRVTVMRFACVCRRASIRYALEAAFWCIKAKR